jgi:hypothetical protein
MPRESIVIAIVRQDTILSYIIYENARVFQTRGKFLLFVPERFDGTERRGFSRRIKSEEDADQQGKEYGKKDGVRGNKRGPAGEAGDQF